MPWGHFWVISCSGHPAPRGHSGGGGLPGQGSNTTTLSAHPQLGPLCTSPSSSDGCGGTGVKPPAAPAPEQSHSRTVAAPTRGCSAAAWGGHQSSRKSSRQDYGQEYVKYVGETETGDRPRRQGEMKFKGI